MTLPWCAVCDRHVWFPKPICPACLTTVEAERTLSGSGDVYSFSIVHRGVPAFADASPYVLAYVSLDDGPTVLANIVGDDALDVAIGDRVALVAGSAPLAMGALRFARSEGQQ
ncbi:DNA-binding protein [Microbacterium ulmi]|uniref:DNA-binding protein n=1 Tax=Microbacterium ulmi TaxID=179095 RepID=A0A7Y2LZY0_9MICO|nr:DNA-binding protein [Microbacterium ulmi]